MPSLLSVLVPSYNEAATIASILERVLRLPVPHEIIVVDDGSRDGTWELLRSIDGIRLARHERNRGKGAALRTALDLARGDVLVVQDADLEYFPEDIPLLYERYRAGDVDAVYGSRVLGDNPYSSVFFYAGGLLVSAVTRLLYRVRLTDVPTGYKMVRTELLREIDVRAEGFDYCAELTASILRAGGRIAEVPIRYKPRTFAEGKKITAWDGVIALWVLLRERIRAPRADARRAVSGRARET